MTYQRDFDKKIRIAIIGVGSHSYRNILPVLNYLPIALCAVCDINETLAKRTAEQYNCAYYTETAQLYANEPQIEAVFICVGPKQHPDLVLEALHQNKHVWVEKPIAVRADQVAKMIQARGDRVVVVGLKKAFMPAAEKVREIIAHKPSGSTKSILAIYHMTMPDNGETILNQEETPNWLRNGVHPLSFMIGVCGPVDEVTAITNAQGHGAVLLKFSSGVMGTLHLASGPQPNVEYYGIYGDDFEMSVVDTKIELRRGIPFNYSETNTYAPPGIESGTIIWQANNCLATLENKAEFTQGFYNETKYFCDCILDNCIPQFGSLEIAHEIMLVYEAGLLSKGTTMHINRPEQHR
ncbi:MAG: Gfo/Idh/MocA family oxidoreductase [Bacillota bacterium]|nr:Gfo/Idh/MocA family oxidoreductase [Bacillota bacterium]